MFQRKPTIARNPEQNIAEVIKNQFYLLCLSGDRKSLGSANSDDSVFFTIDRVLLYEPFYADFGPLNLGKVVRFCQIVTSKLNLPEAKGKKVFLYTSRGPQKKANAAFLVGAYQIICLGRSAQEASASLAHIRPKFVPFRDASQYQCRYKLTVDHCLEALEKAIKLKFFDYPRFDIEHYEFFERVENGDLNLIIPGKFVHFSGPSDSHRDADGYPALTPDDYIDVFKKMGVTDIIRLNKTCYDKTRFTRHGFVHYDMYYTDGTTPTLSLLQKFLAICEQAKGMIAVHCKAGLGRTGTCVGSYMMKHYQMTASEVIGWLRICRPGSVIGHQQFYLEDMQEAMWQSGAIFKKQQISINEPSQLVNDLSAVTNKVAIMNVIDNKNADKQFISSGGPITRSKADQNAKSDIIVESQGDGLVHHKIDAQKRHRNESFDAVNKEDLVTTTKITDQMLQNDQFS